MTQSSLKKQNGEYQPKNLEKWIFSLVPKSSTQMELLGVKKLGHGYFMLGHL
jgi:hypothetical protein